MCFTTVKISVYQGLIRNQMADSSWCMGRLNKGLSTKVRLVRDAHWLVRNPGLGELGAAST